jgi:23S rRNA (adenine2030-N6)-methyltransferase
MNYRHAFHAGNHADVLKHVVLLALLDALRRKPAPFAVLDTHAGRGRYPLDSGEARRTAEAEAGVLRLMDAAFNGKAGKSASAAAIKSPAIARYCEAVCALNPDMEASGALRTVPGSPLLAAYMLREQDRLACCETQPVEFAALAALFARDARVAVHERDGYAAINALLPLKAGSVPIARGLVLIDPPYEAQEAEFDLALAALKDGLARWPQGMFALWYPIKRRRTLHGFLRRAALLQAKNSWVAELLIRPDDSPLRMNGSGVLVLNPPWQVDAEIAAALPILCDALGENGASSNLQWLRREGSN